MEVKFVMDSTLDGEEHCIELCGHTALVTMADRGLDILNEVSIVLAFDTIHRVGR